jgi:hypothetical protein
LVAKLSPSPTTLNRPEIKLLWFYIYRISIHKKFCGENKLSIYLAEIQSLLIYEERRNF